jgi:hypothetical protein
MDLSTTYWRTAPSRDLHEGPSPLLNGFEGRPPSSPGCSTPRVEGPVKKIPLKNPKHYDVISVNKKLNKGQYLLNQWTFIRIHKILLSDLVCNQHTRYIFANQMKWLSLHNERLSLQNEQCLILNK